MACFRLLRAAAVVRPNAGATVATRPHSWALRPSSRGLSGPAPAPPPHALPPEPPKRIRCMTMDVTGTILKFNGRLGNWYRTAAKRCGVVPPHVDDIEEAFDAAYDANSKKHPCFGGDTMSAKEWWRHCVFESFDRAGCHHLNEENKEACFQRIYSLFGSNLTYSAFDDAAPFLRWARRHGVVIGIVSNADERYGDSILPMLGLDEHIDFYCFSKDLLCQKPDREIFETAMRHSHLGDLDPSEVIHIGNSFEKDWEGARNAGMHAALLSRFNHDEEARWAEAGALVMTDLLDVIEWLGRNDIHLGNK